MNAPETPCMKVWQWIDCGRIEGAKSCIAIREDRPVRGWSTPRTTRRPLRTRLSAVVRGDRLHHPACG